MYFPKYWAIGSWSGKGPDGHEVVTDAWGWSDISETDAKNRGEQIAHKCAFADWTKRYNQYAYANRPLREEIVGQIPGGVITRNSYGAEIINTESVAFVDVDIPEEQKNGGGFLSSLFGKKSPVTKVDFEKEKIEKLKIFQKVYTNLSFRVYRTAGGLRYIVSSQSLGPTEPIIENLFRETEADEKYKNLCKIQKSFRARLTPKPWRMDLDRPLSPWFPYAKEEDRKKMAVWIENYNKASLSFAVCTFLETVGSSIINSEIAQLIQEHDKRTAAESDRPLA